jgi:hypothetical protein
MLKLNMKSILKAFALAATLGACSHQTPNGGYVYAYPIISNGTGASFGYINPKSSGTGGCSQFAQAISKENRDHCAKNKPSTP